MFTGVKALWTWMKTHPGTAAVVFLFVIPVVFYYLIGSIRSTVLGLPGIGPLAKKIPDIGAPAAGA